MSGRASSVRARAGLDRRVLPSRDLLPGMDRLSARRPSLPGYRARCASGRQNAWSLLRCRRPLQQRGRSLRDQASWRAFEPSGGKIVTYGPCRRERDCRALGSCREAPCRGRSSGRPRGSDRTRGVKWSSDTIPISRVAGFDAQAGCASQRAYRSRPWS